MAVNEYEFELMDTKVAGHYLGKSPTYLRNNYSRLGIKAYKVGKQLRFRKSELDAWLESQVV
jgi:excisionase family DNA binding protein